MRPFTKKHRHHKKGLTKYNRKIPKQGRLVGGGFCDYWAPWWPCRPGSRSSHRNIHRSATPTRSSRHVSRNPSSSITHKKYNSNKTPIHDFVPFDTFKKDVRYLNPPHNLDKYFNVSIANDWDYFLRALNDTISNPQKEAKNIANADKNVIENIYIIFAQAKSMETKYPNINKVMNETDAVLNNKFNDHKSISISPISDYSPDKD
jgi:hypothetical protein